MNIAMLILAFGLLTYGSIAQDLRNPYVPYLTSIPYPFQFNLGGAPFAFFHDFTNYNVGVPYYEGEYEIGLEHYFWHSDIELNSYNKSYQYEIVSFPFMNDCAFTANGCIQTGSANTHSRELFMPSTSTSVYYTVGGYWDVNNYQYKLYNITPMRPFIDKYSSGYAGGAMANCLVSAAYHGAIVGNRAIIPHSIIRCTINFHCGNDIMATIKFIYDNTRGRMRFYPFYTDNFGSSSNIKLHDVIFVPKLILNSGLDHYYDDSTPTNIVMTSGTINYYPLFYNNIVNSCGRYGTPTLGDQFRLLPDDYYNILPSPFTVLSSSLRSNHGDYLAGYDDYNGQFSVLNGIQIQFHLDQNTSLNMINPIEKVIYNPSETNITANNLVFPSYYTFKTIRGTYPTNTEVNADNLPENGGPFADLRDVPVTTDLYSENPADPTNDHDYASRYYLKPGSKLTVQPCVGLFDATIDAQTGSTLVFEDYTQVRGREHHTFYSGNYNGRFKIRGVGGAILRNYANVQYVQNGNINQPSSLNYIALGSIIAGNDVDPDPDQPDGDYVVQANADVTFTAGNNIHLQPGFSVQGGNFHGHIDENIAVPTPCAPISSQGNPNRFSSSTANQHSEDYFRIHVFPNPNNGSFTVSSSHPLRSVTITDLTGRRILQNENLSSLSLQITLSEKVSGILLVQVTGQDGEMRMEKLVVRFY